MAPGAMAQASKPYALPSVYSAAAAVPDRQFRIADADDPTTFKRDGKCYRFQPNLGRTYEIKCPREGDEDEPEATKPAPPREPTKNTEPPQEHRQSPEPATNKEEPPPAPPLGPAPEDTSAQVTFPEKGTRLRAELMNTARPTFEREIGGSVVFSTKRLAVYGDWAFADVHPLRANGAEIDWSRTKFAAAQKQGMFEADTSFFLLKRVGGKWTVAEAAIGPTDVAWDGWRQQYKLPSALFAN